MLIKKVKEDQAELRINEKTMKERKRLSKSLDRKRIKRIHQTISD